MDDVVYKSPDSRSRNETVTHSATLLQDELEDSDLDFELADADVIDDVIKNPFAFDK